MDESDKHINLLIDKSETIGKLDKQTNQQVDKQTNQTIQTNRHTDKDATIHIHTQTHETTQTTRQWGKPGKSINKEVGKQTSRQNANRPVDAYINPIKDKTETLTHRA